MLTVRTLTVADDEARLAVEPLASPGAFVRPEDPPNPVANTMWVGSAEALGCLGLMEGTQATTGDLAAAIAGRHTMTGEQTRVDGAAFDLTFLAPPSVSWTWSMAKADLRAKIEEAVINAAYYSVQYLVAKLPVDRGTSVRGFAAALALHVVGQPRPQGEPPPPLLHMHCYLVGILDKSWRLYGPRRSSLHKHDLFLAGGAFGRAKLAEDLRGIGFGIDMVTTPDGGLSFEIAGVAEGLLRVGESADKGCAGLGQEATWDHGDSDPWETNPPAGRRRWWPPVWPGRRRP